MRDVAAHLDREQESRRGRPDPVRDHLALREPVEGRVHLDRVEMARVVVEPQPRRAAGRIEDTVPPVVVVPARTTDVNWSHLGVPSRQRLCKPALDGRGGKAATPFDGIASDALAGFNSAPRTAPGTAPVCPPRRLVNALRCRAAPGRKAAPPAGRLRARTRARATVRRRCRPDARPSASRPRPHVLPPGDTT